MELTARNALRAAIYARISDARDGDTAGVDRQVADASELAQRLGWQIVQTFIDNDVSAYAAKPRPAFEKMLEAAQSGDIQAIAVYSSDRLYRRVSDLERLVDALDGVAVETVRSGHVNLTSADGRLLARLLGSVSQHESEKRGERVSRAAAERAKAGKFNGGKRRFGYNANMTALEHDEADALRWAYDHIQAGGSLEAGVREFARRGLTGSVGAKVDGVILRDYLLRAANAGLATYKGEVVGTGKWPAIVTSEQYATVAAILKDPRRRTLPGRPALSLLAPVLRCPLCIARGEHSRVSATKRQRRKAGFPDQLVYRCRAGCVSRDKARLDALISGLVVAYLERHAARLRRPNTSHASDTTTAEAEGLRASLEGLAQLLAAGELNAADYAAGTREIRTRLESLEARIARSTGRPATLAMVTSGDVRTAWEEADIDTKRTVIKELIERVEMGRPARLGPWEPTGIEVVWRDSEEVAA